MTLLRILLGALALLLLGAHLLRWGGPLLALLPLLLLPLAFFRARWARQALQGALLLGTLEWLRTAWVLAAERRAAGQPQLRMLLILAAVAAFTAWAAWVAGPKREPQG